MSIKKILIIGFGSIGRRHYEIAKNKYPEAEIKILRSSETKDSELKNTFFKTEDAIDFDPQLVVVANPASFHISSALPFIKEERYFLIEKPLSIQMDDAEFFLKKCCEKKSIVQVGYNLRFLSSLKFFKKCIHDKLIGDLWSVRSEVGQYLPSWRTNLDYRESVSGQAFLGGGVINELSHEIDLMIYLFGYPKPILSRISNSNKLEIDVEDNADIIFKTNFSSNIHMHLDFHSLPERREINIIFKSKKIRLDLINSKVEIIEKNKRKIKNFKTEKDYIYIKQFENFINNIKNRSLDINSFKNSIDVLKIIHLIKRSNKTL